MPLRLPEIPADDQVTDLSLSLELLSYFYFLLFNNRCAIIRLKNRLRILVNVILTLNTKYVTY